MIFVVRSMKFVKNLSNVKCMNIVVQTVQIISNLGLLLETDKKSFPKIGQLIKPEQFLCPKTKKQVPYTHFLMP